MNTRDDLLKMLAMAAVSTELATDTRDPDAEGLDDDSIDDTLAEAGWADEDDIASDYDEDDYTDGGYEIIDDDDEHPTGSEANTMGSGYATFEHLVMKELSNTEDDIEYTFKVTVTNHGSDESIEIVLHGHDEEGFEVYRDSIFKRVPPGGTREVTAKMYVSDTDGYRRVKRWVCDDGY